MKNKILVFLILISSYCFGQSVPDTNTFTLQNVSVVIGGSSLSSCFTNSIADYFDPAYGSKTMSPQSLYGFRNYTVIVSSPCDSSQTYQGGQNYPTEVAINLGSSTGVTKLYYTMFSRPDRAIVMLDGNIVIDTGYRGSLDYTFGGSLRINFTNALNGKIDPEFGYTYPNFTYWSDDGYPRVFETTSPSFFNKVSSSSMATVKIFSPMDDTVWHFILMCPE